VIRINPLRKGLKDGLSYVGTFIKMTDASSVEIIAMSGFDFLIIDCEHTHFSKETVVSLLRAADISGIVPIVRVRENDRAQILHALDSGALGIMVPETSSRAAIEQVIDSTYYAPLGNRGFTASNRAAGYGFTDAAAYVDMANENIMTIVYAETARALDNLDEMLAVPGIDVMWIGPMDLSQALGVTGQPRHPKVLAAVDQIIQASRRAGIAVGTIAADADEAQQLLAKGVQFIGLSSDQAMIKYTARQFMKNLRTKS
jgi:4-hydroxy-2-oxoheptanedioate aldolase